MPLKQDKTLTLTHNDLAEGAGPILRKGMSATSRKDYTGVFKASTIYMLEKVIETSSVKILSGYYHTNLEGGAREEDAKKMQETFPR